MIMAKVMKCGVKECAYNKEDRCHTMAITIGDATNPMCDTFCQSGNKGGDFTSLAGVGACKVAVCKYNSNLECQSPGITVGYHGKEPDCLTFKAK